MVCNVNAKICKLFLFLGIIFIQETNVKNISVTVIELGNIKKVNNLNQRNLPNYSSWFEVRTHHMHMKNFITFQCRKQSSTYAYVGICNKRLFWPCILFIFPVFCHLSFQFRVASSQSQLLKMKISQVGVWQYRGNCYLSLWQKINKLLFDVSAPMMFCFQKTLSSRLLNSFASQCVIIIYYPGKYRHAQ